MEMEWKKVPTIYETEEKANKAAGIITTTEARLASIPKGPQYEVEIKVERTSGGWQVAWRKVFVGFASGCGKECGSSSCSSEPQVKKAGKVIPFRRLQDKIEKK